MGNYSFTAIFTKAPVVIAGAIRSVLFVLVLMRVVDLSVEQLAGIAIALELALGLFAHQSSTSMNFPNLAVGTPVNSGSAVVASIDPPPSPTVTTTDPNVPPPP
jgi:hypothetical protein